MRSAGSGASPAAPSPLLLAPQKPLLTCPSHLQQVAQLGPSTAQARAAAVKALVVTRHCS